MLLPDPPGWDLLLATGTGWGSCGCGLRFFLVAGRWWLCWVVLCLFWWGPLWVLLSTLADLGWLPAVAALVASCPSRLWVLWWPPPALLARGLPLVSVARFCSLSGSPCCLLGPVGGALPLPPRGASAGPTGAVFCLAWWCPVAVVVRLRSPGTVADFGRVVSQFPSGGSCGCRSCSCLVGGLVPFGGLVVRPGELVAVGPCLSWLVGLFYWGRPLSARLLRLHACVVWEALLPRCVPVFSCWLVGGVSLLSPRAVWFRGFATLSLCPPCAAACTGLCGYFLLVCRCVGSGCGLCPSSVCHVASVHTWARGQYSVLGVTFWRLRVGCCASGFSCVCGGYGGRGAAGTASLGVGLPGAPPAPLPLVGAQRV